MRWPWQRVEDRAATATTSVIDALHRRFAGEHDPVSASTLSAAVYAADLLSRLAGSALIEGLPAGVSLPTGFLSRVVRNITLSGESIWAMLPGREGLTLVEACSVDVDGDGADPDTWKFKLQFPAPAGQVGGNFQSTSILNFQWASDPLAPWRGIGPLQAASGTSDLAARVTQILSSEMSGPIGHFLPVSVEPKKFSGIMGEVESARGGVVAVESQRGSGMSRVDERAPGSTDWKTSRFGPMPTTETVSLCQSLYLEVLQLCGIPAALADSASQGDTSREGRRRLLTDTLTPIGIRLTEEMSLKMEAQITLDWSGAMVVDVMARSRAYASLVAAGMDKEQATAYALG